MRIGITGPKLDRHAISVFCVDPTARFLQRVPKGRLGEASDLAGPLLFLASGASDFYTGHILYADGGYTAG